jgi:hypothetical protein
MKKYTIPFFIFLCLSFNIINVTPVAAVNIFNEGVYKVTDFNFSPNSLYIVQNISTSNSVYVLILDENQLQIQAIKLVPMSLKFNLVPLKPDYRIVIVGNGNVYIS